MNEIQINSKIATYKFFSIFPFYRATALKKIQKYENRKAELLEKKEKEKADSGFNICRYSSRLSFLSQTTKTKILIIGSFYKNDISNFYTNMLLKNIEYKDNIIDFYDTDKKCLINFNNAQFMQNRNMLDIQYYMPLRNIDMSLYDVSVLITDFSYELKLLNSPKIFYLYCSDTKKYIEDKHSCYINRTFDAVFIPYPKEKNELNGVSVPIIHLPVYLNLKHYLQLKKTANKDILYIGDVKKSLNIAKSLSSLNKYLEEKQVKIHIKYREGFDVLGIEYPLDSDKKQLISYSTDNIIIEKADQWQFFSEVKKQAFAANAIIYDGTCIDFMYNPFQALAAGRQIFAPAWFGQAKKVPGAHIYNSYTDLTEQIKHYINSATDDGEEERRKFSRTYRIKENSVAYKFLSDFSAIKKITSENYYRDGCFFISYDNLYIKCKKYLDRHNYNVSGNITIIPANDAGFFSIYNKYASYLAYAKTDEIIIPDWRCLSVYKNIYKHYNVEKLNSFCYAAIPDGNLFLKLFETPYSENVFPSELYQSDAMYEYADRIVNISEYNFDNEPDLTYIYSYELPKNEEYYKQFRFKYNKAITEKMKPLPYIMDQINKFKSINLDGHFCISVHVRCAAHAMELLEQTRFQSYDEQINKILYSEKIDIKNGNWRLFIATDNDVSLDYFRQKYSSHAVWQKGIKRLTIDQEKEYENMKKKSGKDIYGYELQHRQAENESGHSVQLAIDILTDVYLLASCSHFIYQNSNVSTAVSYINTDIKMHYAG